MSFGHDFKHSGCFDYSVKVIGLLLLALFELLVFVVVLFVLFALGLLFFHARFAEDYRSLWHLGLWLLRLNRLLFFFLLRTGCERASARTGKERAERTVFRAKIAFRLWLLVVDVGNGGLFVGLAWADKYAVAWAFILGRFLV